MRTLTLFFNKRKRHSMDGFLQFIKEYPGYENPLLDDVRKSNYESLTDVYADWTGAALPPKSLVMAGKEFLMSNFLGNPHSSHFPSRLATDEINSTREAILKFLNAPPEEYEVIFTSNATNAILLLQHYIFAGGELLLTADNHNSVNGLREIAKQKGAIVRYSPINSDLTFDEDALMHYLTHPRTNNNRLFCYPAKSNYAGTLHSLKWVSIAQENGYDVLLDAAAYLANNRLDLSVVKPDFVPVSFYKLFGYPTGIGCLVIKKSKYSRLHKSWFSGGSILIVSVKRDFYALESLGYARFEDGTPNFANIPLVKNGLRFLESLGDMNKIGQRAKTLASWLHDGLNGLAVNGGSVVVHSAKGNDTVTFSVRKGDKMLDAWLFERAASEKGIFVRSGCFCNPGVNEKIFNYSVVRLENSYSYPAPLKEISMEEKRSFLDGEAIGGIRASLGFVNNFRDMEKFVDFTRNFLRNL